MQRDVEQPALAGGGNLRQAGNRLSVQLAVLADNAQPARALGYQHPAVGKEGEAPRMLQPVGDLHHAQRVLLRRDCLGKTGERQQHKG